MDIAIVVRSFHNNGGISKHSVELAEFLVKKHNVHVVTNYWDESLDIVKKITMHKVNKPKKNLIMDFLLFIIYSTLYLIKNRSKFDLIVSNGCGTTLVHDILVEHSFHSGWINYKIKHQKGIKSKLWFLNPMHSINLIVENINYRKAKFVVAISNVVKDQVLKKYNIKSDNIKVIYNGVNCRQFITENKTYNRHKLIRELGLNDNDKILLFIGWELERKGFGTIIKALDTIKRDDIKLLVVGSDANSRIKSIIESKGLKNHVMFLGKRNNTDYYYSAADLFVFPTYYEAFGLVILESLACGTPVITSKIAGAAELITHQKEGLLLNDPSNASELTEQLLHVVDDSQGIYRMGQNGRKLAEEYDWNKVCAQYEETLLKTWERMKVE
ncbi:glycosyltransferase family 4 protein [Lentibacillus sp. Marseille-P4043]|uniref:glycosyltransferase family 4 protein n=1 Tax=Lentibacillus sp. Marseille-P4043 TaxID=2040293 RepID=UPI00131A511C|nr:glycosyltransferase family 4 protein [Lentibacillus sp. Marseille-P4043]